MQSKPWYTPFWFMLGVLLLSCLQQVVIFKVIIKSSTYIPSGKVLLFLLMWPSICLVEAIIYWVIRRRVFERKWVWAHLILTACAMGLIDLLAIVLFVFASQMVSAQPIRRFQFYSFWSCLVIGHVFFIVAFVRSFSGNSAQLPPDDNDLLSEIAS